MKTLIELSYFATPCLLLVLVFIQLKTGVEIEAIRRKVEAAESKTPKK